MKIFIGSDHAGYNLKTSLKEFLLVAGHEVEDLGVDNAEVKADYPTAPRKLVKLLRRALIREAYWFVKRSWNVYCGE